MSDLVSAALSGDFIKARAVHQRFYPLMSAFLKLDTNPVPVKTALALKGMVRGDLRLPMVSMADAKKEELHAVLAGLGLV
jgi:4-hydroxy-tetrahydrodipicolinate synthase